MPITYDNIATTTLGSAAASIDFTSIPATYTDLRLVFVNQGTGTAGNSRFLRFNSDSSSSYSRTKLVGTGVEAYSGQQIEQTTLRFTEAGTSASPVWQLQTVDIFSYAGSTNKTCLMISNEDNNGSGNILTGVGLWRSTAAITSISLFLTTGTFAAGTIATLYGIKNF